ncbi:MAG: hypothetical protein OXI18_05070 [bacterium]|nr:hypothetical protein [bacterium]
MNRWTGVVIATVLTLPLALAVAAQEQEGYNVEIRVWESTSDASKNYISVRPEGGSWGTLGTIALPLEEETANGRYRYGDVAISVPRVLTAESAVLVSGTGSQVKPLTLAEGNHVCEFSMSGNRTTRGHAFNASVRAYKPSGGRDGLFSGNEEEAYRQMVVPVTPHQVGEWLLSVKAAAPATWTFACPPREESAATVEIRVWEATGDPSQNFISARPAGGSWETLGTIALPLTGETANGRYRYGDVTLRVSKATESPTSFSGSGARVRLFTLAEGNHICEFTISDNEVDFIFRVTARSALPLYGGHLVANANEDGTWHGVVQVSAAEVGVWPFEIFASPDSSWTLSCSPQASP